MWLRQAPDSTSAPAAPSMLKRSCASPRNAASRAVRVLGVQCQAYRWKAGEQHRPQHEAPQPQQCDQPEQRHADPCIPLPGRRGNPTVAAPVGYRAEQADHAVLHRQRQERDHDAGQLRPATVPPSADVVQQRLQPGLAAGMYRAGMGQLAQGAVQECIGAGAASTSSGSASSRRARVA